MDKPTEHTFDMPRRTFVTTLVAGFTLAAGPVSADAIITDATGLDAGQVDVPVVDGKMPAYRARPAGKTGAPVVLVVQEIFGVHEHIKDLCRRLAHAGYYAIAPSLYARYGDPGKYDMAHIQDLIKDVISHVKDSEVMSDLEFRRRVREGRGGGCIEACDHRLLLGRAYRVALCGAQSRAEGGHRVVRAAGRDGTRRSGRTPRSSWRAM